MRIIIIVIPILVLIASCRKDNDRNEEKKTAAELLTQKQWILSVGGFDDNQNGVVDPGENILTDCQEDNKYVFNANGTGTVIDDGPTCTPPANTNFSWKLLDNDRKLEISFEQYSILSLTENELVLSHHMPGLTSDFILTYRH